MTQHELARDVRVVPAYQVDTLGSPFRVTLKESVEIRTDGATGKEIVHIPDFVGMAHTVARCRAAHPRKLSGKDIVFLRKALGIRAKSLADYLDVSPEHLSRCETGTKVLSSATEKVLRLFVFAASFFKSPDELLNSIRGSNESEAVRRPNTTGSDDKTGNAFLEYFLTLKIQSVFSADDELHFELIRRCSHDVHEHPCGESAEDGKWSSDNLAAA